MSDKKGNVLARGLFDEWRQGAQMCEASLFLAFSILGDNLNSTPSPLKTEEEIPAEDSLLLV